jgi:hypothetical protein
VRDPFHEAAVAEEHVRVVVDYGHAGAIELRREMLLGERHADGIREALPQRPGRRFDTQFELALGMPCYA